MTVVLAILKVILVIICVALTVLVLLQEGKNAGLGQAISGGSSSSSYVSKNYARTPEGKKKTYTKILGAAFVIISLVVNILQSAA